MEKEHQKAVILEIFLNVSLHKFASEIIRTHSSNPRDIREVALEKLELSNCKKILDVGCGFGFFTEALRGRIHPEALVTGLDMIQGYEPFFLENCRRSGFKGLFLSSGLAPIREFQAGAFDLILCSYALYFFPNIIPELSQILDASGHFVAITHDSSNMEELIQVIKNILRERNKLSQDRLPVEEIISQFSSENGKALLAPWFARVERIDYHNSLCFEMENLSPLIDYFRFKSPFFLSGTSVNKEEVIKLLDQHLRSSLGQIDRFRISKNDSIFVCSEPVRVTEK